MQQDPQKNPLSDITTGLPMNLKTELLKDDIARLKV